jgi:YegS/Rv2252/BmrU family lipid kinase
MIMSKQKQEKILIIFNASAGTRAKDRFASVIFKELRNHFKTVTITETRSQTHGEEIVKDAGNLFDLVAVLGGDGTINSIAHGIIGTDLTLGILPGGSGNGLARNLKIPMVWRRALSTLKFGKDRYFDIGIINNKVFFNVAGIGLDGYISKKFNTESTSRGILPYIYYGFKGFKECPEFSLEIDLDGKKMKKKILLAAFANFKQYGGKAVIAPKAIADDGYLDLCLIERFPLTAGLVNSSKLFTGNISKFPYYNSYKFKELQIKSTSGPIPCTVDGEYIENESEFYEVKVVHKKIKIRVPVNKL